MRLLAVIAIVVAASGGAASARDYHPAKPCRPSEVGSLVVRFIDAFNAGNLTRLNRTFARKPYFRWYSTSAPGERLLPLASDRAGLVRYLARRHELGERLTLTALRVNGNTIATGRGWKTYGNFVFTLVREASDLQPTAYQGKGTLHCYSSRPDQLIVWTMAPEQ